MHERPKLIRHDTDTAFAEAGWSLAVIDIDAPRFADTVPGGGHLAAFVTPADLGPA